jgi:hypothetical protein
MSHRHRLAVGLAAIAGAVAIAACGTGASSYSASGSAQSSSNQTAFVNFSKCMRANGVTNFPDPGGGGGIQLSASSGINPFSPAFKAAQSHCRKLLPGGGPPTGPPSAQAERQALEVSECMRKHGVSGFPDPTLKAPSSPAGYTAIQDDGGVILAIPSTINVQSPAFQQAAKACQFGGG